MYRFNSDTLSGVCPEVMKKLNEVNVGYAKPYFDDEETEKAIQMMKSHFSKEVEVRFVSNGTAANVMALNQMCDTFNSIICASTAHAFIHEVGGPEFIIGCKTVGCDCSDGKLTPDLIATKLNAFSDLKCSWPKAVLLSQVTELGTTYTTKELKAICDFSHKNGLLVYVDGARVANAAAYLNINLKEMFEDTGVDVFSFGGTKNGCMFGEMLVFLNTDLAKYFINRQKQCMQVFTKSRYLAAQFTAILENDLWLEMGKHANSYAKMLENGLKLKGYSPIYKVESNAVYVIIEKEKMKEISKTYSLEYWDESEKSVRIMTNFSTTKEDIDNLINLM